MAAPQSSMIIKKLDGFGGSFVDSQYLGNSYETGKPHVFQDTLMKIFSSSNKFFTGKPLLSLTGGTSSGVTEIDTEVYRWYLQGAEYKCARSLEVLHTADTTPGLNNTTFQIKLDLDYFHAPDVLFPEDADFPLEIVGTPYQHGIGYVYTVRIQGDDPTTFLPMEYLQPGKEFSKVWTTTASEYAVVLRCVVIHR